MAENTSVFLISRRIGGNFAQVQIVVGIRRLQDGNAVFCVQDFFYRVKGLDGKSFFDTYS